MQQVANILLAHAGRGGGGGVAGAAAEIARAAARSWLAPLLDTACDRLAFVLRNLFDLAAERNRNNESLDGTVGSFHSQFDFTDNLTRLILSLRRACLISQLNRRKMEGEYGWLCWFSCRA